MHKSKSSDFICALRLALIVGFHCAQPNLHAALTCFQVRVQATVMNHYVADNFLKVCIQ